MLGDIISGAWVTCIGYRIERYQWYDHLPFDANDALSTIEPGHPACRYQHWYLVSKRHRCVQGLLYESEYNNDRVDSCGSLAHCWAACNYVIRPTHHPEGIPEV